MSTTQVIHRSLRWTPPRAVRGEGVHLYDESGKAYIDASGGAAVSCLGHGHPAVLAAMHAQIDQLAYAHTSFFTTEVQEELAHNLIDHAPGSLRSPDSKTYFVSGGSEAMESALKMARQYWLDRGEPARTRFIARKQSYHGNTLGALAIGGNAWRRAPYAPLLVEATHVSNCYPYREKGAHETDEAYVARLAGELDAAIVQLGAKNVIAFVAETVGGATAGVLAPVPGYWQAMHAVCKRHNILLILDEVMCGMGRTGSLHACEQEGITPDLIAIAKGLGGGYQPIGAVIAGGHIVEPMAQKTGYFQHSHTYIGHPTACAASLAVQKVLTTPGFMAGVAAKGTAFGQALHAAFDTHPYIGEVRGRGMFWGIEFVSDKTSKAPFDPMRQINARLKLNAMKEGVLVYTMGGTVDGKLGDHVVLAPPFIATQSELQSIIERLSRAIETTLNG